MVDAGPMAQTSIYLFVATLTFASLGCLARGRLVLAIGLLAYAGLTRPESGFFLGLLGLGMVWLGWRRGDRTWVTRGGAGIALAIALSVLHLTLLQRLNIHEGERHAIATIARYTIILIGCVYVSSALGLAWSKVQWLAAGISVGLGFGLQEIFANFVSGLILLFERPVRVGDTVQIGETLGTVTRIRIRATTIEGWDKRELIIPNREFVTGQIIVVDGGENLATLGRNRAAWEGP